jgi:hypothetical protein
MSSDPPYPAGTDGSGAPSSSEAMRPVRQGAGHSKAAPYEAMQGSHVKERKFGGRATKSAFSARTSLGVEAVYGSRFSV